MQLHTALTWSSLNCLTKQRYDDLKSVFGDLDTALEKLDAKILRQIGCREETAANLLKQRNMFDADAYEKKLATCNVQLLTIEDDHYPTLLKHIGDPPIFLYCKGDIRLLREPCIALVGTRKMTSYGRRVTDHFVPPLVRAGVVSVSGLALGIDAEVAKQTLAAGGKTIAVLGNGLASIYPPSNKQLAEEILEKGGLLLSEFPLDMQPDKYTFPARNRIIAGVSLGTVVLEAALGSGAIITAELAIDYGRDVFVVPGQIFDPNMRGCHALLAKGTAKLVMDPNDILEEFNIASASDRQRSTFIPQTTEESAVHRVLTAMPQRVDEIVLRSGLEVQQVNVALTLMELSRGVKHVGNGQWVRT